MTNMDQPGIEALAAELRIKSAQVELLRDALGDCLHVIGNQWLRWVPDIERWPALKEAARTRKGTFTDGDERQFIMGHAAWTKGKNVHELTFTSPIGTYEKIGDTHPAKALVLAGQLRGEFMCDAVAHNAEDGCPNPACFKYAGAPAS